ncbi:MAG: VTT domain-containing protein [Pseudomonadota bacterium]
MANRFLPISNTPSLRVLLKGAVTIGVLIALGFAANTIDFEGTFERFSFGVDKSGFWNGPWGFLLFASGMILIYCPRQVVSFFAAYFFGLTIGVGLALAATVIGCIITLSVARLFQSFFKDFLKGKLDIAVRFWRENTFFATLIWRFLPLGSNQMTNMAAGAFGVPSIRFVLGSAIGYIPQTVIFAIMGSGVEVGSQSRILLSIALFVVSALLGLMLYSRFRKQL